VDREYVKRKLAEVRVAIAQLYLVFNRVVCVIGQRFKQKTDTKSAVYETNSSRKYRTEHSVHGVRMHGSLTKLLLQQQKTITRSLLLQNQQPYQQLAAASFPL
jgi:hypothetical protein